MNDISELLKDLVANSEKADIKKTAGLGAGIGAALGLANGRPVRSAIIGAGLGAGLAWVLSEINGADADESGQDPQAEADHDV